LWLLEKEFVVIFGDECLQLQESRPQSLANRHFFTTQYSARTYVNHNRIAVQASVAKGPHEMLWLFAVSLW
jgi:hypothetical protein